MPAAESETSVFDMYATRPPDVSLHAAAWVEAFVRTILREHGRESAIAVADELKGFIGQKVAAAMDGSDWRESSDFDTVTE